MKIRPKNSPLTRKPAWLKRSLPTGPEYERVRSLISESNLNTVCQEAKCPNQWECYSNRTATFMILGARCTRNCRYCAVENGPDGLPAADEPQRVAEAAKLLGLSYVVVTSVTRDDLPDGGAGIFAETIRQTRAANPEALVEVLIPDFNGDPEALKTVLDAGPAVLNHNIETVAALFPEIRPGASYRQSLELLRRSGEHRPDIPVKSGIMLGLGETDEQIRETIGDLLSAGCAILTLGQYLQPSKAHVPVDRFIHPDTFAAWEEEARKMGFAAVAAGPFVRSSYDSRKLFLETR